MKTTSNLDNIHMGKHVAAATHLCKAKCVHDLSLWRLVDILRSQVNDLVHIQIAGKLDFTYFG